jgi:hypothetical protein
VDSLIMPVLTDEETLDEALRRMAQTDSRALLVRHFSEQPAGGDTMPAPEGYVLYMNRSVVSAWGAGKPTCRELSEYQGEAVPVLWSLAELAPVRSLQELVEVQLDQLGSRLGLPFPPRPGDSTAVVVTRHEFIRDEIASAALACGCGGPMRHTALSPPADAGKPCPICGYDYTCW